MFWNIQYRCHSGYRNELRHARPLHGRRHLDRIVDLCERNAPGKYSTHAVRPAQATAHGGCTNGRPPAAAARSKTQAATARRGRRSGHRRKPRRLGAPKRPARRVRPLPTRRNGRTRHAAAPCVQAGARRHATARLAGTGGGGGGAGGAGAFRPLAAARGGGCARRRRGPPVVYHHGGWTQGAASCLLPVRRGDPTTPDRVGRLRRLMPRNCDGRKPPARRAKEVQQRWPVLRGWVARPRPWLPCC